jgi:hypothetical protein
VGGLKGRKLKKRRKNISENTTLITTSWLPNEGFSVSSNFITIKT